MAGIIVFGYGDWNISSNGFRAMACGVNNYLSDNADAAEVRGVLTLAVDSELYFIDTINSFSIEMFGEFLKAVDSYLYELSSKGAAGADDPELFEGHSARISELAELLRRANNPTGYNSKL